MTEPTPITIDEMLEWLGSGCPFCADVSDDPHYLAIRAILEREKARTSELPEGWDWNDFKEWRNARTND